MPEIPVASLDARQQKLVDNARLALERGNLDYAIEVTAQILRAQPGCLPVRRLQRVAQLRAARAKGGGLMAKVAAGFSTAPFLFGGKKQPAQKLEAAEALLAKNPQNVAALRMLAEAARALGLRETVAFALDAVRELEPQDRTNRLALGEAWLDAAKPAEALKVADELLREKPADAEAQHLMRRASVAQTVTQAGWENQASYRDKLRDESQAVLLEQGAKLKVADTMAERLIDEHIARVAKEPENLNHYRTLVQTYRQLGAFDEALAWVRKARQQPAGRLDPTLEKTESDLAIAVLEAGVQNAEQEVARASGDAAAQARATLARQELGEFRRQEAWRQVQRYPNDFAARYALAQLLLEAGEIDGAIAQFQQAQKGPQVRVASLLGLGRCFKAKGLHDLAAAQFAAAKNELGAMDEVKKDALYELGACYETMGRADAAIAEFKAIYSEDIGFRDVAEKINAFYAKT
jgi:tetratricopeptide (TPR) repeat protein